MQYFSAEHSCLSRDQYVTNPFLLNFIREERIENLQHLPPHLLTNPVEIAEHLKTIKQTNEKLSLPLGS